ncbi:MAG: M24 family metallopeptidase [Wenzhouxiangella sp.]|nr:M24 family metallopeptidase [Wenzhouxiangella sp.]
MPHTTPLTCTPTHPPTRPVRLASLAWMAAQALALLLVSAGAWGNADQGRTIDSADGFAVLDPRDRIAPENAVVNHRIEALLPELMAEADLDLWLVINREYAEDPVYFSLVPQPSFAARRTTMLAFERFEDEAGDEAVRALSVNRYPLGEPYQVAWSGESLDAQWQALADLIVETDAERVGINVSTHWPVADGLTHGLYERLLDVLPESHHERLVSAESLVVRWLETRTEQELDLYPHIVGIARGVISEAFSNRVITPGVTTTDDVAWYIRERFESLGLPIWFMPYVNVQRPGEACAEDQAFCGVSGVIERGDVIHTDVGICYLKLCTDTQEMGYVLKTGQTSVPQGLIEAMAVGNRWQDHLTASFQTGRSGNAILAETIERSEADGIQSSTYTHPLGFFGHAPGPTIGMWDNQGETPVRGDWPVHPNTAYAIEGNIKARVREWDDQHVQVKLEQVAWFDGQSVIYAAGRQTEWHVIR